MVQVVQSPIYRDALALTIALKNHMINHKII